MWKSTCSWRPNAKEAAGATPVRLVFSGKIDAEKERLLCRPPTKKSRAGCGVSRDERDRGSCRSPRRA